MSKDFSVLSIYVPVSLRGSLDAAASAHGCSRSAFVKTLLERELSADGGGLPSRIDRQLFFCQLALDAILKHHPKADIRGTVHATFQARRGRPAEASEEAGL